MILHGDEGIDRRHFHSKKLQPFDMRFIALDMFDRTTQKQYISERKFVERMFIAALLGKYSSATRDV